MLVVDSSALIAYARTEDENNGRATELLDGISETRLITDHILDEVITFLAKRDGPQKAYAFAELLLNNEKVEIAYCNPARTTSALELLRRHAGLSFCDALSVAVMQERGIREVLSFDADFDKVKGLVRIH